MLKNICKYIKIEIFSYITPSRRIELVKLSKYLIEELEIKESMNMYNFCKKYYIKCAQKPSLYILLRNFKSEVSSNDFIHLYSHCMNDFTNKFPNELIKLDMLLDPDIVEYILNKNLLKTNKIHLRISSLDIMFNKNLNFRDNQNIEEISFNIFDLDDIYFYNNNPDITYLLFLKYLNKLIPTNVSKIRLPFVSSNDISSEKLKIIMDKLNINIENINNEEQIIKLIFKELSQYKNVNIYDFFGNKAMSTKTLKTYNSIFKSGNYNIINNLKEINFLFNLSNKEDLDALNEFITINNIKDKLKLSIDLPKFFINLTEYDAKNKIYLQLQYLGKEIFKNLMLPKKLKALDIEYNGIIKYNDVLYPSEFLTNIFKQCFNLEELSLNCRVIDIDYESFKYLVNLKYLNISCFNLNHLNDLIKALNKYNQNITDLQIFILNDYYKDNNKEVNLDTNFELKI